MDLSQVLAVVAVISFGVAVVNFLQRMLRRLDDIVDLNVKQLELTAVLVSRPDVLQGFLSRSGRMIVPKDLSKRARAADA